MYIEILFVIGAFCIYRSICGDVIKDAVSVRIGRWRQLNKLVATTENNRMKVVFISFKLIFRTIYVVLIQYMNNSVRRLDNKTYELTYVIKGRMYKMIVTPKRGPIPILLIINDLGEDVTNHVLPYMGPQYDWHGFRFNTQFFGCNSLTFYMGDGTEWTHENKNDILPTISK